MTPSIQKSAANMADPPDPPSATGGSSATADLPVIASSTINIRLPPFWPADPAIWFAQVEATFATKKLTSQKSRFDFVVASLSPEVSMEVRDLVLHPPETNAYDTLKETLIKRTAASKQRRLQQLFQAEELGYKKPTQLLRWMNQLLGDNTTLNQSVLRELFLQRLPANVRMVTPSGTSLENLADLADKVTEVAAPTVAGVKPPAADPPPPSTPAPNPQYEHILAEMAKLQATVAKLTRARSRTPGRHSRRPSPSPEPLPSNNICWYHRKFGNEAKKCTHPAATQTRRPGTRDDRCPRPNR